jgi:hypothetical protein
MSSISRVLAAAAAGITLILMAATSFDTSLAYPSGISGRTLKGPTPGCTPCHGGGQNTTVTLTGPSTMEVNTTAVCTVQVSGTNTGVDIAVSGGELSESSSRLKTLDSELTHPSPGSGTYVFTYRAPATPGTETIYATGVTSRNGPWNHAQSLVITITGTVSDVTDEQPLAYALEQNFPNPFNPSTRIAYSIPEAARVRLEVYNLTGELVATLVDEPEAAGHYAVTFENPGLPSGMYLYRISAGNFVATRKFLLLK